MGKENGLWRRYLDEGDSDARQQLILMYLPLVRYVLGRMSVYLPSSLERDDLVSHGIVGLIQAVDHFDTGRGVKFKTYATIRIRGHILDVLRAMDLLPRGMRERASRIGKTLTKLTKELGRSPTDREVADKLNISVQELRKSLRDASVTFVSLDAPVNGGYSQDDALLVEEVISKATIPLPAEQLDRNEIRRGLAEALSKLSEREQLLTSLYYFEQLTMKEVGAVLEISESRVCQIHSKVLLTLRGCLQQYATDADSNLVRETRPLIPATGGRRVQYASTAG